jgi:hypothetical protein
MISSRGCEWSRLVKVMDFLVSMSEISRLSGSRDWIDLGFVERERTSESARVLGIFELSGNSSYFET